MNDFMEEKLIRVFAFSIDVAVLFVISIILYYIFGFPRLFNYFSASNDLLQIMESEIYNDTFFKNEEMFNNMLIDILKIFIIYESTCLILFRQTVGKFLLKLKLKVKSKNKLFSILIIILRTTLKALSFLYVIPLIIIAISYFISTSNLTIIDKLCKTEVLTFGEV